MDELKLDRLPPEAVSRVLGGAAAAGLASKAILCCMMTNQPITQSNAVRFAADWLDADDPAFDDWVKLILHHVDEVLKSVGKAMKAQGSA